MVGLLVTATVGLITAATILMVAAITILSFIVLIMAMAQVGAMVGEALIMEVPIGVAITTDTITVTMTVIMVAAGAIQTMEDHNATMATEAA